MTTITTNPRGGTVYNNIWKFLSDRDSGLGLGTGTMPLDSGTEMELETVMELGWPELTRVCNCVVGAGGGREEEGGGGKR